MDVNLDLDSISGTPNNFSNEIAKKPMILMGLIVVIVLYYIFFSSLGGTTPTTQEGGSSFGLLMFAILIIVLMSNGMMFLFNTDINASMKNILSPSPEIDVVVETDDTDLVTPVKSKEKEKEVFHIPDNKYNYDDAKAICVSYGGRLATYQEISDAYDKGADWCSYGWSDGQMGLFPTQKLKWESLQSKDGHEHDCGRPGINGGYIDNPNVRFGVNCYGYKPDITQEEVLQMENSTLHKKTQKEIDFENKVDLWRTKISNILIAPFNHNTWSIM